MSDPRETPDPEFSNRCDPAMVKVPLVDLLRRPDGQRDRQLVFGADVTVLHELDGWALVRAMRDGYCGWLSAETIGPRLVATHQVTARLTHAYAQADIKSADRSLLSFGSRVSAVSETATFIETSVGFVPRQHLHRVDVPGTDPAAVASVFEGTPYLWGGNSGTGIDCSGLIQAACLACGIPCPGDSDQQAIRLGEVLGAGAELRRNDLLFWKGHVALITDSATLIHANAGHMAVTYEPIEEAVARIELQGDGPVTIRRRLPTPSGPVV